MSGASRDPRVEAARRAKISAAMRGRPRPPLSPEHRTKLSAAFIGRSLSPTTRAKISAAKQGRSVSTAHRAKLSAALQGRALSPEHCAKMSAALTRHGHARHGRRSPTYRSWRAMLSRVRDPARREFPRYGGAGIRVCARWTRFEAFLADLGERPPGTTLDRLDSNGHYEPGNVRWSTPKEQARNRRPWGSVTRRGRRV